MIHMVIPGLPPSVNEAYSDVIVSRGKKKIAMRVLSSKGRKYKKEIPAFLVQNFPAELMLFRVSTPYGIAIQFAVTDLENKTWCTPGGAKNRYKKMDVSNRLKLVEDVVAEAGGYDDSQNLTVIADKCKHYLEETRIWVWDIVQEGEFPDAVLNALRGV